MKLDFVSCKPARSLKHDHVPTIITMQLNHALSGFLGPPFRLLSLVFTHVSQKASGLSSAAATAESTSAYAPQ